VPWRLETLVVETVEGGRGPVHVYSMPVKREGDDGEEEFREHESMESQLGEDRDRGHHGTF
jgi:hypothetical protein